MDVSIFKNVFEVSNPFTKDVLFCLNRIKNGASKELVQKIRDGNGNKNQLAGVCFNGVFKYRSEDGLVNRSGLMVLDFDKVGKKESIELKNKIRA